jgi:hypothetical protein
MGAITASQIAERIGVSVATAWRWSRRGRFGPPADESASAWRFTECPELDMLIEHNRPKGLANVWKSPDARNYNMRRLGQFVSGERVTDAEDLEMASMLLNIAARQFERRREGKASPAAVSAEAVGRIMLSRNRAGDETTGQRMQGTAARLAALAESGNGKCPP